MKFPVVKQVGSLTLTIRETVAHISEGETYIACLPRGDNVTWLQCIPEVAKHYDRILEVVSKLWK